MRLRFLTVLLCPLLLHAEDKPNPPPAPNADTARRLLDMRMKADMAVNDAKAKMQQAVAAAQQKLQPQPAPAVPGKQRQLTMEELKKFYAEEKDRIATDWVDSSMRQAVFDAFWKAGYVPVVSEGKLEDGQCYYRKSFKFLTDVFPDAAKVKPWCQTGISEASFKLKDAELQKDGFTLMQMQTFVDEDGDIRYSACWVKILPLEE